MSSLDSLPRSILTSSILSYSTSGDLLGIRASSKALHDIVQDEDSELWRLALIRDFKFQRGTDCLQAIHPPPININEEHLGSPQVPFLRTGDVFAARSHFESWKNWRRLNLAYHVSGIKVDEMILDCDEGQFIVGPYFLRAASLWAKVEHWCNSDASGRAGDDILSSLTPGRAYLLPPTDCPPINTAAFQAIYSFYAGQDEGVMKTRSALPVSAVAMERLPESFNPYTGLFGGYRAYDIVSSSRWLEPDLDLLSQGKLRVSTDDRNLITVVDFNDISDVVGEAGADTDASEPGCGQIFFVHPDRSSGHMRRKIATPTEHGVKTTDLDGGFVEDLNDPTEGRDSLLRYFEEHAHRLHAQLYEVGDMSPVRGREMMALVRCPSTRDTLKCSRAVTRGVEIVASAVYSPFMSMYVYSIRIKLLGPGDEGYMTPKERGFDTCQLVSRHWRISYDVPGRNQPRVEEVRGDGIIGKYPKLFEGHANNYEGERFGDLQPMERVDGPFVYQSCTDGQFQGKMSGSLQFQPGSIIDASGDVFDAEVKSFPLQYPDFYY
mmetsp:Transcript_2490/g.5524  ORF Transcript_2490/g.5524 Transcript_2490/m.5524 type:complete len:549 (-) Transcript_2490:1038-2684(-)